MREEFLFARGAILAPLIPILRQGWCCAHV
jgi:hypothetical protein